MLHAIDDTDYLVQFRRLCMDQRSPSSDFRRRLEIAFGGDFEGEFEYSREDDCWHSENINASSTNFDLARQTCLDSPRGHLLFDGLTVNLLNSLFFEVNSQEAIEFRIGRKATSESYRLSNELTGLQFVDIKKLPLEIYSVEHSPAKLLIKGFLDLDESPLAHIGSGSRTAIGFSQNFRQQFNSAVNDRYPHLTNFDLGSRLDKIFKEQARRQRLAQQYVVLPEAPDVPRAVLEKVLGSILAEPIVSVSNADIFAPGRQSANQQCIFSYASNGGKARGMEVFIQRCGKCGGPRALGTFDNVDSLHPNEFLDSAFRNEGDMALKEWHVRICDEPWTRGSATRV